MSEDISKVLISAPLIEQLDDGEFEDFCHNGFSIVSDELDDLWYDIELEEIIPAVDPNGVQGLVYVFHMGKSSDGSVYHETNLPLSELISVISEMASLGCDLNEVKVHSYMYYNCVEEPFLF